jgi:TPP-dependent pyruvate/acetoin dehydrogenase alpha subunit
VNNELNLRLLRNMLRIRMVETAIAEKYPEQEMRCPVHLSIGQEAVPAAFAECIADRDFAVSTHRGHAHYLGKGGDLNAMIAEIYGKATGCSAGKGGSMHLIDRDVNFMGTSAIVGNSIPVGVGLALSAQIRQSDQISCIFVGDGAVEEGVFYESVNFAATRSLPVLFLCENNSYSVYSPLSVRQPEGRSISAMVAAMGIEASYWDGNDATASYGAILAGVESVRTESRPMFMEFATYRHLEHCGPSPDDDLGYRPDAEVTHWFDRDPVRTLRDKLLADDPTLEPAITEIEKQIVAEISAAFSFAAESAWPLAETAFEGVYS